MKTKLLAQRLSYGDLIGVVSPSKPVTKDLKSGLDEGVERLKKLGFQVKLGRYIFQPASPKERAQDINEMFADAQVKAIITAQGGSEANTILEFLDYQLISSHPKIFLGFSDATVLLNAIYQKTGLITFHGSDVIFGFGRFSSPSSIESFVDFLVKRIATEIKSDANRQTVIAGQAEGDLIGGNLKTLVKLSGTDYLPDFQNKILFIEDHSVTTSPASVMSQLYQLKHQGVFGQVKGLWLGHYQHENQVSYEEIISKFLRFNDIHLPVLKSDNFGHQVSNITIPLGVKVNLDATNKHIKILDAYLLP